MTEPDDLFTALFARHRAELRLHCYRMLGSSHDSDDLVQETWLLAWRAHETLSGVANARAWLYRIATNACLAELQKRRARRRSFELEAATPGAVAASRSLEGGGSEEAFVEPCPDAWREGASQDPEARVAARETLTLAFVAALQHLTPPQRATLLLRDVCELSARETAEALGVELEAANSALHRARDAIRAKLCGRSPEEVARASEVDPALLARYLDVWRRADLDAFLGLLHADARTTMPPIPTWVDGRAEHAAFYAPMFTAMARGAMRWAVVPVGANGQAACAFYRSSNRDEPATLRAIQTLEAKDGAIVAIDHFLLPRVARLFGLPDAIA